MAAVAAPTVRARPVPPSRLPDLARLAYAAVVVLVAMEVWFATPRLSATSLWVFALFVIGSWSFAHAGAELFMDWRYGACVRTMDVLPRSTPPQWHGPWLVNQSKGTWYFVTGGDPTEAEGDRPGNWKEAVLVNLVWHRKEAILFVRLGGPKDGAPPDDARCAELLKHLSSREWIEYTDGSSSRLRRWACFLSPPPKPGPFTLPDGTSVADLLG